MLDGYNAFGKPKSELNDTQRAILYNDIQRELPLILEQPEQYKRFEQANTDKLDRHREKIKAKGGLERLTTSVAATPDTSLDRRVLYESTDAPIVISYKQMGNGRYHYPVVGENARLYQRDLTPLWKEMRKRENEKREKLSLPLLEDKDNWGGNSEAFGSSKTFILVEGKKERVGSVLTPQEVAEEIEKFMGASAA
jgi:hypothetical protein